MSNPSIIKNIDTYSNKGYNHKICQDYVIHGIYPIKYVILSDGCSGSEHSDIGARILAHQAKNALSKYITELTNIHTPPDEVLYEKIGRWVIEESHVTAVQIGLNDSCLDATLILSFEICGSIFTYMYGDGIIIFKYSNGTIGYHDISFPKTNDIKTAPYYLSYLLNANRRSDYKNSFPNYKIYNKVNISDNVQESIKIGYADPVVFSADYRIVTINIISSDGLKTLIDFNTKDRLDLKEVVTNILDFKSLKGEFIRKRVNKYIKTIPKTIVNYDDLSLSGFYISGDDE